MSRSLARRLAMSAAVVVVLGFATSAGATAYFEIDSCDSPIVLGKAKLMRDLDCSGAVLPNIFIDRGTLDLNGHTLVTGDNYGVFCFGKCKVIGPGTITGGSGVDSAESLKMKNVTISLNGGIGAAAGTGSLLLQNVTITGAALGAIGTTRATLIDTTVTATVVGVVSGSGSLTDGPCEKGGVVLRRSSVTGTTPCPGGEQVKNCADVISCKRPKILKSTCNTSCQAGAGAPCPTWGVCAAD